jgi:ABC-2 type transport system ATP-binding protein
MEPDDGEALVLGCHTVKHTDRLKDHLGYMPQRFGLYDDLTVAENLAFYGELYQAPKTVFPRRAADLLDFANLTAFQSRLAAQLSGGMRQKLGLICVLIHTPHILFLDEPTFGVDPVSRREFWQILHRLLKEGMTIFLSTSYMDEAERAHRVGLIDKGRLLMADTPAALKAAFQGELLEVHTSDLRGAGKLLAGQPQARHLLTTGDRLLLTVDRAESAIPPLLALLQEAGAADAHLARVEPALEDLFVQLVRQERP